MQKTGYIAEAGKCLVMEAVIEGRNVVIVLLDSMGKYTRVADAKRIKTWMEASATRARAGVDALTPLVAAAWLAVHRMICELLRKLELNRCASCLASVAGLLWLIVNPPAIAADRTLSVTIYDDDLALVQDRRDIDVKGGRQRIEFQDVSAQIRPETVSLTAADISIVEQNFDFDLLTPAKLMEKAVGQEITIVRVNPATGAETREQAQVLATNGGVVLKIGQRIEVLRDDGLPVRVIFDKVPDNLRARPTLSVTIIGAHAGTRPATLSYLTPGLGWSADYVALYDEGDGKIDVQGWVTLTNSSGTTYDNAQTLLVAGSPSQVDGGATRRITWRAPQPRRRCSRPVPKAAAASGWATTTSTRWRNAPPSPICRPSR